MHHSLLVQVGHTSQDLHCNEPNDCLLDLAHLLKNMSEGTSIHELKSDVDLTFFLEGAIRLQHIVMLAIMQHFKLDQYLFAHFLIRLERYFLHGDDFLSWLVNSFLYHAARPLTKYLDCNEVLNSHLYATTAKHFVTRYKCLITLALACRRSHLLCHLLCCNFFVHLRQVYTLSIG